MPETAAQTDLYFQMDNDAVQTASHQSQTSSQLLLELCASSLRSLDIGMSLRQYMACEVPPEKRLDFCFFLQVLYDCRCIPDAHTHIPTHSAVFPSIGYVKCPSPECFQASLQTALCQLTPESNLQYCYSLPNPP